MSSPNKTAPAADKPTVPHISTRGPVIPTFKGKTRRVEFNLEDGSARAKKYKAAAQARVDAMDAEYDTCWKEMARVFGDFCKTTQTTEFHLRVDRGHTASRAAMLDFVKFLKDVKQYPFRVIKDCERYDMVLTLKFEEAIPILEKAEGVTSTVEDDEYEEDDKVDRKECNNWDSPRRVW